MESDFILRATDKDTQALCDSQIATVKLIEFLGDKELYPELDYNSKVVHKWKVKLRHRDEIGKLYGTYSYETLMNILKKRASMDEQIRKRRIRRIREAYNICKIQSITFHSDGSGAEFIYTDPVGDHGLPCLVSLSLGIKDVMEVIAGMRLKIGDIPTTLKIEK